MGNNDLEELVANFYRCKLAIVGDVMLDRYIFGQASRISQEAPVPIVQIDHTSEVPGGAANVAMNANTLGGGASVFGVIGRDREGEILEQLLTGQGIGVEGLIRVNRRKTTVKTRVIGNRQQIVRVDAEDNTSLPENERDRVYSKLAEGICEGRFHGVIFEDYAKGLLTPQLVQKIIDLGNRHNIFTILDPHPSHAFNVTGLAAMTPNRAEAFGLAGTYFRDSVMPLHEDLPLQTVGAEIMRLWQCRLLLITLGADGMALFSPAEQVRHIPTRAREVFDVSGAGDTVTASFTMAMLAGASHWQAANLANHAAGIVVGKIGTAPVTASELLRDLREDYG